MSDDDFEDDISLDDDSFDDFEKKSQTLGDMWRDNPIFKIGVIIGAVILIFIVINVVTGNKEQSADQSYVGAAPAVSTAPGTEKASPAYIQAIEEQNEADVEYAEQTGGSALPVPIEPPVGLVSVPEDAAEEEDPLQRWRRLQEERLQKEIQQREKLDKSLEVDQSHADAVTQLASLMSEQMSSILGTKSESNVSNLDGTSAGFLDYLEYMENGGNTGDGDSGDGSSSSVEGEFEEEVIQEVLLPAGKIEYAQLLIEANSDVPGPVLARILSGPFAGMRILGSFEVQNDLLILSFDTLVYGEETLSVNAIAMDPDTTLTGMATEVDHRYLQRILLPAAAAFVEGVASAVEESGSTTITINNEATTSTEDNDADSDQEIASGVAEVGTEIREILDEMVDDIETLVRIDAGTPIGILFVEPVVTEDETI